MNHMLRSAGLLSGLIASSVVLAQAPRMEPLPIRETVNANAFVLFKPLQLSADGRWVAYTLQARERVTPELDPMFNGMRRTGVPEPYVGTDIWVVDTRGGTPRNITNAQGSNWNASWSPDNKQLAFMSDRGGSAGLWIWDRESGQSRQVSQAILQGRGALPAWTPDSRTIVTIALLEGMTVAEAAMIRNGEKPGPKSGPTSVIYRSTQAAKDFGDERGTAAGFSMAKPPATTDLVAIDVASGQVRRLTNKIDIGSYALAPDGKSVAYTRSQPNAEARSQQLVVTIEWVSLADGQTRTIARDVKMGFQTEMNWSPDARYLAFPIKGSATLPQLGVVEASGGEPRIFNVGDKMDQAGGDTKREGRAAAIPLWSQDSKQVVILSNDKLWRVRPNETTATAFDSGKLPLRMLRRLMTSHYQSPDGGRSVYLMTLDPELLREGLMTVDLNTGKTKMIRQDSVHYGGYWADDGVDVAKDGSRMVFIRESAKESPDIWVAGAGLSKPSRLTHTNELFDRYALGDARLISWQGADGQKLQGALLLPPGYQDGQRVPLVLHVYAGSFLSGHVNRFGFGSGGVATENLQLFATRGIAVLKPDTPLGRGNPMRELADGLAAAAKQAIALGYADPKKIGITGQSYGGYSTLSSIVTHPELYAAAVERAGPGNLTSFYGVFDDNGGNFGVGWSEEGQGRMDGTLWEQRERYINNSPLFFLDQVKTPLLIIHGTADDTVPPAETAQIFVALRRMDKTVEYARYRGEGHWEGTWSADNQIDYCERLLGWFERYMAVGKPH